jgi:hypothetical protein
MSRTIPEYRGFVSAQPEHCSAHRQLVQTKEPIGQSGISPMKKKQAGSTVTQSTVENERRDCTFKST